MADGHGKQALKAGLGYTVGNILCRGFSFISAFIFARLMSPTDYGIYNTFASYVSILSVVIGFAIHVTIKNAKLDYGEQLERYCSSVLLIPILNMLALLLVSELFRESLGTWLAIPSVLVGMIVLESFSHAIMSLYNEYLAVHFESRKYLVVTIFYAIIGTLLSVALICTVFSEQRYVGRALGALIPLLLISGYIIWFFFHKNKPKVVKKYWAYALKISLPIVPHGLSQIVLSQFDRIMIKKLIGDVAAGFYSFANNIGFIFQVITNSMDTAWTPWFFEQMKEKKYAVISKTTGIYISFVSVMAVGLLFISPELVFVMGGNDYYESRYVVLPIVLSVYYAFLYTIPSSVEYYYKKTKIISIGTMSAAVLNIVLNSVFISRFGYVAAAYTTAFCYLCYFVVHLIFSAKIHGKMIFPVRTILLWLVLVSISMFISLWLMDYVWIRMALVFVGLLFFVFMGFKNINIIKKMLHGMRS